MEKKMGQKHSLSRIRIRGSPLLKYHTNRRKKSLRHTPASQRPKDGEHEGGGARAWKETTTTTTKKKKKVFLRRWYILLKRARVCHWKHECTHTHTREGVLSFFLSFFFRCVWVLLCAGGKNVCLVNRVIIGSKHFFAFFLTERV